MMEDRGGQVLAVAVLFFVLCWIAVALRIYCRGWIIRSLGVDDKLMIGLMLIFTVYLITQFQGVRYGTGRHRTELSPEHNRDALMYWYICELLYIISTCMLKISVGYFLLRVAIRRTHIWILRILMISTVLFGTAYFFMVMFQCTPIPTFWEESPRTPGKCFSNRVVLVMTYTASIINCLADWAFGILPLFIVWSLSLPKRTRLLAFAILSFAAIGSAATIARSVYIPTLLNGDDFLWATADVALWSTVEPGIGITAASIATLRPLWQLIWYRAGVSSQAPRAVAWRERFQGKPTYVRSEASGGRQQPMRNDLADASFDEEIEVDEIQTKIGTELPRIQLSDNNVASPAPARLSGLSHTFDIYSRDKLDEDGDSLIVTREDSSGGQWLSPSPGKHGEEPEIELEGGIYSSPIEGPAVDPIAPVVDWRSPRMSAISMGFGSTNRESTHSATTWGIGNLDSVSRRESRATADVRNSRFDRSSRATRASSHHTRGSQFLAAPSPGNYPMPTPPANTWQTNVPGGMDSAQWLSSKMAEHPGYPGSKR